MERTDTNDGAPQETFGLRLIAEACDGPRVLRDRLLAAGLDVFTIARVAGCSPRAITRAGDGGQTPRGVLIRLAGLAVIVDDLAANGVPIDAVSGPRTPAQEAAIAGIAEQSDIARRLVERLASIRRRNPQLTLAVAS